LRINVVLLFIYEGSASNYCCMYEIRLTIFVVNVLVYIFSFIFIMILLIF